MYISLLNGVFKSKGAGWIPYRTGIKKILEIVATKKGGDFPELELYELYNKNLHFFKTTILADDLDRLDNQALYYLIYDCSRTVRQQDIDHIHPVNLLEKNYPWDKINSVANFQLLDSKTNRGEKNGKEFMDWISRSEHDIPAYTSRHLIPVNQQLWSSANFNDFLDERKKLIKAKIEKCLARHSI